MERKAYWYSVIQYIPDYVRGEKINVGLILHCPGEGTVFHSFLDENSNKVRSLLSNEVSQKTFKVQKDYADLYMNQIIETRTLLDPDALSSSFIKDFQKMIPKEFVLSEPTYAMTIDPNQLFETLQRKYIGESILSKEIIQSTSDSTEYVRNVKSYTKQYFTQRKWLGSKIKSNVKFHPIEDIKNMEFVIDFVFKNGIWNLMQTTPSNSTIEKLTDWFSKNRTLLEMYQKDTKFYVLYDSEDQLNKDNTVTDMIHYLQKDSRVKMAEINSPSFIDLCEKVENEGKDISQYTEELIAM